MIVETHLDPTGSLTFAIERADDGLISLGFAGFPWHLHPELLIGSFGATSETALEAFKHALLGDELVIAVVRKGQQVVEVSVSDDPSSERRWLSEDEELELRYWSGRHWSGEEPRIL